MVPWSIRANNADHILGMLHSMTLDNMHSRLWVQIEVGSLLLLLSIEIRWKLYGNFSSVRMGTNCNWGLIIPRYGGINIVAKHEICCESLLRSSPTAAWPRGAKRARHCVSVFLPKRKYVRFPWTRFSLPSARHYSQLRLAQAAIK